MSEANILAPLGFIIISLITGAVLKIALHKINIPYTIGLFILGLGMGILFFNGHFDGAPFIKQSIEMACNINPDLVLNIFLPILIFSAAFELDVHIFRKTLFNTSMLALPGMVIAMILTAVLMMAIGHFAPSYSSWTWAYALMFGALISATDPVAVVALLSELGVSKRFSTLIDGESMLNDGTGIVLFMMFFAPLTASIDQADPSPIISLLIVILGGVAMGYLMARLVLKYFSLQGAKCDIFLQTSVVILMAYLTFILAQDIFKLSGVIALVCYGLAISYHGVTKMDEKAQGFMREFWGVLSYIANTLIFVIIGIIVAGKVQFSWSDLAVVLTVYVGINVIRLLMIGILYPLLKRHGYGLSKREGVILTWGALRGALGLTLALMVSTTESIPEDIRRQILLLTASMVSLTLVVNGTTTKFLLEKLGLLKNSETTDLMRENVKSQLLRQSRNYLEEGLKSNADLKEADWSKVENVLDCKDDKCLANPKDVDLVAGLRVQLISQLKRKILNLYAEGVISIRTQRKLLAALDHMVDRDGYCPLDKQLEELGMKHDFHSQTKTNFIHKHRWLRHLLFVTSPQRKYELALGLKLTHREIVKSIEDIKSSSVISAEQLGKIKVIEDEVQRVLSAADQTLEHIALDLPEEYKNAVTLRAKRMLKNYEYAQLNQMEVEGLITAEDREFISKELTS